MEIRNILEPEQHNIAGRAKGFWTATGAVTRLR